MDWSTAQRVRRDCFHDEVWGRGGGPPDRRGQLAAGADPDSITLTNGDLEFRWSCDATHVGNT